MIESGKLGGGVNPQSADEVKAAVLAALNGLKARIDAKPSPGAYITKSYNSGSSWYRVWSDGFKECGFSATRSSYGNETATLPVTFSTTTYRVMTQVVANRYLGYGDGHMSIVSKSYSSFVHIAKGTYTYDFYVAGY